MVRVGAGGPGTANASDFPALRDAGDPGIWQSLNGLWEWEPASEPGPGAGPGRPGACPPPPFGRPLNRSILVPLLCALPLCLGPGHTQYAILGLPHPPSEPVGAL